MLTQPCGFCSVMNAVKSSGGLREELFNAAYNAKRQALLKGKNASPMWDRLVFDKIKAKRGGGFVLWFQGRLHCLLMSLIFLKCKLVFNTFLSQRSYIPIITSFNRKITCFQVLWLTCIIVIFTKSF
ncbi:putative long-chain-fatty-acid--CoA ligase [Helianthus annuus]|uniref:Long-chain-fatty-acid--CoA ligase n=1 Tax=Helianthus annuus TaxID=4232 RepID=A0A251SRL6_HELAN|nr:putative long-chain-fatty-acid--CoA ligase [Helianthus annuus]